jgi:DNA polymerase-3 subunit delta
MDALQFLDKSAKAKRQPVYALSGDEDFLKRRCREKIVAAVLGGADPEFAVATYAGEKLDFSTVRNDLDTLPFLAPCRVVVVESADPFVTEYRSALEQYVAKPSPAGVLILDAKTFPETTKLAKALPDAAKLVCKAPPPFKVADWAAGWAHAHHGKPLSADAAARLVDLVGPQLGLLDQELEKLAAAVGDKPRIEAADVDALVGRSREANVFQILVRVGDGQPGAALKLLGEVLDEGQHPLMVLGALGSQLRKMATVGRLLNLGLPPGEAMNEAGIGKWPKAREEADRLLRHLGRGRLAQLPDWLLELDLGLKGGNPLPPRLQLERLIVRLARPREGAK